MPHVTEHQLENADAAHEHFQSAQEILDAHIDDPTTYESNLEWWIFARTLRAEAEQTIFQD